MNTSKILKIYLFISGLILTAIGSLTIFNPINIKANEGIEIAENASALNDVRSFGMLLLATALLSFLGSFKSPFRKSAAISTFLLFLSLGLGRLLSIFLDGMPSDGMVKATGLEIILGMLGLILFISNSKKQSF
ncbi:DUF4345 domain-containing protein [Pontimicrobium sp. IMCC45349]|uniref:DUF4345 domain-containing protein n=1 Tax=Pontimicrobium sp. IMCC45349 TaxID=3391574 RepID=UPI0039A2841E